MVREDENQYGENDNYGEEEDGNGVADADGGEGHGQGDDWTNDHEGEFQEKSDSDEKNNGGDENNDNNDGGQNENGGGQDDKGIAMESESLRKLFIGGLDRKTSEEDLQTHFSQFGELIDVVVMRDPKTKDSRGFGFVTFATMSQLDKAQDHRPHKINGRQVQPKRAIPRSEMANPESANTVKKIFITGIKDEMTDDDFREYFGQFGNVISINLVNDKESGKKKGYGFVEFDDYDPVDKAVLLASHVIKESKLEVKKAFDRDSQGRVVGQPPRRGGRGGGRGGGSFRGGFNEGPSWGGQGGSPWQSGGPWGGNRGRQDWSGDDYYSGDNYGSGFGGGYQQNFGAGPAKTGFGGGRGGNRPAPYQRGGKGRGGGMGGGRGRGGFRGGRGGQSQ